MIDPWGSWQNFMKELKSFKSNPMEYALTKWGIPSNMMDNPDAMIEHMMGEGKISQAQYNAARKTATQIMQHPLFGKLIK